MVAEPPVLPNIAALRGLDRRLANIERRLRDLEVPPPPVGMPFPTPGAALLARLSAVESLASINRETLDPTTPAGAGYLSGIIDPRIDSRIMAASPGLIAAVNTELGSSTPLRATATTLIDGRISASVGSAILPAVASEAGRSGSPLRTAIQTVAGPVAEVRVGNALNVPNSVIRTRIEARIRDIVGTDLTNPTSGIRTALSTAIKPITVALQGIKAEFDENVTGSLVDEWNELVTRIQGLRAGQVRPNPRGIIAAVQRIISGTSILIRAGLVGPPADIAVGQAEALAGLTDLLTWSGTINTWMDRSERIDDVVGRRGGRIRDRLKVIFARIRL